MTGSTIRIGTRGSKLALWQANWVASAIRTCHSGVSTELCVIKTKGDRILNIPLSEIGGKALFIKEIEMCLLNGSIDIAVHSMKDMPGGIPDGLCIGAIPERETPADVLISKNGQRFSDLAPGKRIATGSLRRAALLRHARPDIEVLPIRGNLDTRLAKLETQEMDAVVLAAAGVKRLGLEDRITEYLDERIVLPAVGQGALCIQTRTADAEVISVVAPLDHQETRLTVLGERAFLDRLEGSCKVPVAAHGKTENGVIALTGLVADIDGSTVIRDALSGPASSSEEIGAQLAERLLSMGAGDILEGLTQRG